MGSLTSTVVDTAFRLRSEKRWRAVQSPQQHDGKMLPFSVSDQHPIASFAQQADGARAVYPISHVQYSSTFVLQCEHMSLMMAMSSVLGISAARYT